MKGMQATSPFQSINSARMSAAFPAARTLSVATKLKGISESRPESMVTTGMPSRSALSTTGVNALVSQAASTTASTSLLI